MYWIQNMETNHQLKIIEIFRQLNELLHHYRNEHNEQGYVECCQTKLSRYPAIIMHMARHLQPDAFK